MTSRAAAKGRRLLPSVAVCVASTLLLTPAAANADALPLRLTDPTANEKVASGIFLSLGGCNVKRSLSLAVEKRWGNDYMHARYYSPNLGRFLSVDPIGGTVGSSQSWNRYSYVLNNPLSLIDPDGRDIEVATGTRRDREAKRMLVQAIRRPGFRAEIAAIANDPSFLLTYRSGSLNTSKELITARAFPEASTLDVGLATVKTGEGGKRVGTDLKMDVDAIGLSQDPSGVSTVGHEINAHVKDIRDGKPFSEIAATDIAPEGGISPADQIGQDTLNEKTDISTKEAKEILAKWAAETAARRANSN